jgi:hypothetical protein
MIARACFERLIVCSVLLLVATAALAADPEFKPLFNGKDLSGWVNVNVAPGTFTVKNGIIVSTGKPTGVIHSDRQYENFILELEWRHMQPMGNAGLFVWSAPFTAPGTPFARSIEVQILDGRNSETYTSHGDVFSIHGSTMKPDRPHPAGAMRSLPSERRAKPSPEWNHYRVVCNDGVIKLSVNGKEVSGGSECNYRKGYICLESEGSECHFRNIKIAELPSTGAKPEQTAPLAEGFVPLYTGLDLNGWKVADGDAEHWKPTDWTLKYDGKSAAKGPSLVSDKQFADYLLICDWRLLRGDAAAADRPAGISLRGGEQAITIAMPAGGSGQPLGAKTGKNADKGRNQWNRTMVTVRGNKASVSVNGEVVLPLTEIPGLATRGPIGIIAGGTPLDLASLLIRELK